MLTHVKGGTGAGLKMHRRTVPKDGWQCTHGHANAGLRRDVSRVRLPREAATLT